MEINRRQWIQQSMLASAALLTAGSASAYGCAPRFRNKMEDGTIHLNWNENPYGPSKAATEAVTNSMKFANRYPDEHIVKVKEQLSRIHSVKPENILLTAGSTEVLSVLGQHIGLKKGEILTPYPSFPTLLQFGITSGANVEKVDLEGGYKIDLGKLLNAITDKTSLVFICNPNNPTGTELETEELKNFCRSVPENVLICIDEAYIEYSKTGPSGSMNVLTKELPNLVVCRTFSKAHGLAGLRMGYAISDKANITALRNRHLGFELSTGWPPLVAASASLDDPDFIKMVVKKNKEGRQIAYDAFDDWGVSYSPSSTNFIYVRHDRFDKEVVSKMEEKGILITKWPDMRDHIRVSIGKPNEMQSFVEVAKEFLI